MASTGERAKTNRRFFRVNCISVLCRRVLNVRLFYIARRRYVLNQVSLRCMDEFTRYGIRSPPLSSNMVNRSFILSRFRSLTIGGPSQTSTFIGIQAVLPRGITMVFISGTSLRAFASTNFNLGSFLYRMDPCLLFNRSTWKRSRATRGFLQRLPRRV